MKLKVLIGIPVTLILAATWKTGKNTEVGGMPVMAQAAERECVHIGHIIQATDTVRLQRFGVGEFSPTSLGAKLCAGDRLQVAGSGNAAFHCFEKNDFISVPPGKPWEVSAHCPQPSNSISSPDGPIPNPRGNQGQLNILTPSHNTALLNFRPVFRWDGFDGASSYTLHLEGVGVNWTRAGVTGTELAYPSEESELQYENTYSLTIIAENNNSTENLAQETVRFSTLDEDEAEFVRKRKQEIEEKRFAEEAQVLALVGLYRQYNLNVDAIAILEASLKGVMETADVYLTLGELYMQVGQYEQALKHYKQALDLAISTGNIAAQAEAEIQIVKLDKARKVVGF